MDEIAHELGMDPVELRKKNMIRLGDIDELSAQLGEGKKGLPRHIRSSWFARNAWSAVPRRSTGCVSAIFRSKPASSSLRSRRT